MRSLNSSVGSWKRCVFVRWSRRKKRSNPEEQGGASVCGAPLFFCDFVLADVSMFAGNDLKERTIDLNTESKLFLPLSPDELERVYEGRLPRRKSSGKPSAGRRPFNTTYRVETTAHDVVLRMGPMASGTPFAVWRKT